MMFVHCPLHVISIARKVSLQLCLYTVVSISPSHCAGQKNIAKSGAGTQNRIECCGEEKCRSVWVGGICEGWKGRIGVTSYSMLDLFVECWLQYRIVTGFFLMRFLIMYTLMYTVFSGALVRSHCLHPSGSRCVTMFRLVVLRARIAREIAVPNSDVRKKPPFSHETAMCNW